MFAAAAPKIVVALVFVSGVGGSNVTVMTGGRYLYAVSRCQAEPKHGGLAQPGECLDD